MHVYFVLGLVVVVAFAIVYNVVIVFQIQYEYKGRKGQQ